MKNVLRTKRAVNGLVAIVLAVAAVVPSILPSKASAYSLPTQRFIKMSSSASGAGTAGQDVTYQVSFITNNGGAAGNVGGLVVDFCAGNSTPIISDTCTAPTGFNLNKATLALANQTGITGFAIDSTNTTASKLVLTRTASSIATGVTFAIDLGTSAANDGVTNPTDTDTVTVGTQLGTFYARVLTFATSAGAQAYTSTNIDNTGANVVPDAGGIALSLADQITIQSKVQERLTFCVYTVATDGTASNFTNCTVSTTNPVTLGDANGVLSSTQPSISKKARYNITTNASNGATIRAKGTTLTSGAFTVDPAGATPGDGTGQVWSANKEQFGMCTYRDTGGGTTGLTPVSPYASANCAGTTGGQGSGNDNSAIFAFDTSTANDNWTTTYGDSIATKSAGDFSSGVLTFLGAVSNTTEPGVYTTTLTFIATGNY